MLCCFGQAVDVGDKSGCSRENAAAQNKEKNGGYFQKKKFRRKRPCPIARTMIVARKRALKGARKSKLQ